MIILDNQTDTKIKTDILEEIVKFLSITKDIELLIVNNNIIKKINFEYRGIDKETDVLSFPLTGNIKYTPLGSIIISIDKAKEFSNILKHTLEQEVILLFIHGLLHLLGFDHEIDNGEMREKEKEIISFFNLPKSLIIRTQGV